jgi:hypothetical protein
MPSGCKAAFISDSSWNNVVMTGNDEFSGSPQAGTPPLGWSTWADFRAWASLGDGMVCEALPAFLMVLRLGTHCLHIRGAPLAKLESLEHGQHAPDWSQSVTLPTAVASMRVAVFVHELEACQPRWQCVQWVNTSLGDP